MSYEIDQFLKFLQADVFAKNKMDPKLRIIYEDFEQKFEQSFAAAGGVTLSDEEENALKDKIATQVPGIKEARAAYMEALEEWDETNDGNS